MKIKLSQTGRGLAVLVGILTAMIASGCASQNASQGTMQYAPQDTSQQGARTKREADYTVIVHFTDGCPTRVEPTSQDACTLPDNLRPTADLVCAKRGKAIEWVSNPAGTPFQVYFDPFVGRPYHSHGKEEKTSAIIVRRDSWVGKYEYSVLGVACTNGKPVLDPPIRVED